jgi:hypothetical protein
MSCSTWNELFHVERNVSKQAEVIQRPYLSNNSESFLQVLRPRNIRVAALLQ